jgi:uncharacterized membrane protein
MTRLQRANDTLPRILLRGSMTAVNSYRFWLIVIILGALVLRLYNLTYHSLWFDEAISIHWAKQSIPRILEVGFTLAEDRLPPLYYLMLKGWTTLFGFGEASVRSLSILFGMLLVPVMASIAALLFTRRVALLTAALIALNPFLIWYSQEARMYAPAVFFGVWASWAFLKMVQAASRSPLITTRRHPAGRIGADKQGAGDNPNLSHYPQITVRFTAHFLGLFGLFVLAAVAGLYSHLYVAFLLPALGLWLIVSYPLRWRLWFVSAIGGVLVIIAYWPIALAVWRFSGEAAPGEPFGGLTQRAWWLFQSFLVWKAPLAPVWQNTVPIVTAAFVFLAYIKPRSADSTLSTGPGDDHPQAKRRIPHPLLFVTLLLLIPFAIATLLLFRNHLAFFGERYFIVMVPWLLVLVAVGATNLSVWLDGLVHQARFRRSRDQAGTGLTADGAQLGRPTYLGYLPYLVLFVMTIIPLPGQWSTPAAKEAWRQSVEYLAQQAAPTDGILIHPDWVRFPFQYYFQGPGQTYAAFSSVSSETVLDDRLRGVTGDHDVIWLIQSHVADPDPDRLVEKWFSKRYPLVTELHPPGISIKGFAQNYQLDRLPPRATPVDIRFDNGLHLVGYQAKLATSATDDLFHPPSAWVHVTLYWTGEAPISSDARPYVHLVGPEGVWGASLDRPDDSLGFFPPAMWLSDQERDPSPSIIRHDLDVNLNPATPPGPYQLVVGLHGTESNFSLAEIVVR